MDNNKGQITMTVVFDYNNLDIEETKPHIVKTDLENMIISHFRTNQIWGTDLKLTGINSTITPK